jgi:hypothetical protein
LPGPSRLVYSPVPHLRFTPPILSSKPVIDIQALSFA